MSVSDVKDFLRKLVIEEYYIDPKAYDNPDQASILKELATALFRYRVEKMVCAVPSPHIVDEIINVIASPKAARVIRTREGESSLRQPDKPEEESLLEILKLIQKQPPSGGNVYNVQGNVGEITTTYANAVKEIDDAKNIPEEKKSKLKQSLSYLKENSPTLLPIATELIKKFPSPPLVFLERNKKAQVRRVITSLALKEERKRKEKPYHQDN